jgi:hypothetical protein
MCTECTLKLWTFFIVVSEVVLLDLWLLLYNYMILGLIRISHLLYWCSSRLCHLQSTRVLPAIQVEFQGATEWKITRVHKITELFLCNSLYFR